MSDLATTYLAQARQHLAAGNTEEAIDLLKHAVVVGPPSEEVAGMIFAALAEAYQRAGRLREAAQYRKRAEALHREPTRRAVRNCSLQAKGVADCHHSFASLKG